MRLDTITVATVCCFVVILCGVVFVVNTALRRNDRVGRVLCLAFVSAILSTLADTIVAMRPDEWWVGTVADAARVLVFGTFWSGLRAAGDRRPLLGVPFVASLVVLVVDLVFAQGEPGSPGDGVMLLGAAVFAILGFLESIRGWLSRSLNSRFFGVGLVIAGLFFAASFFVLAAVPDATVLHGIFDANNRVLIVTGVVVVGVTNLSLIHRERYQRPGLHAPSELEATGLLSTAQFRTLAEVWLERAARDRIVLVLVLVEFAGIDEINLAFDRRVGDNAIRHVGRLASDNAPAAALACRIGRDRSAMLFAMSDEQQPWRVAERINADALSSVLDDIEMFRLTVYLGGASTRAAGSSYDELLAAAEASLAVAVASGRPGTFESAI